MTDFFCEVFQVLLILSLVFGVCWPAKQIQLLNSVRILTVRGGKLATPTLAAVRIQQVTSTATWLHTVVALAEGCRTLFLDHYFTLRSRFVVIYFVQLRSATTCGRCSFVFLEE